MMLLLICLTVGSCKHKQLPDAPAFPKPSVKQTIVDQLFCTPKNCNPETQQPCECIRKSACNFYDLDDNGNFGKPTQKPIKECHGILGITAKEYNDTLKFKRDMEYYIIKLLKKCGSRCK